MAMTAELLAAATACRCQLLHHKLLQQPVERQFNELDNGDGRALQATLNTGPLDRSRERQCRTRSTLYCHNENFNR
ncbi:hypothetical protein E2562_013650 [Oryza meyeriana var. granulata]|uniref:Uncharacterized protein n=1 Tax=Oryza meyeriana var. granulata TaxID=110450 RepID=A0A6G1BKB6_9ORYZ|nr:hypothetical protein E2562_013650 [Oryza meyeriana var. granulata]